MTTDVVLTEQSAYSLLVAACEQAGLDPAGAVLIRLGSNAVFRLVEPVIIRIARDGETLENARVQIKVARWLEDAEYPATRALSLDQPLCVDGHVATYWVSVSEEETYPHLGQVGQMIRRLHQLEYPTGLDLPARRPFEDIDRRMAGLANLAHDDAEFLRARIDSLRAAYAGLEFVLEPGVIHGDANVGNVIVDRNGHPVLIDLDSFSVGPREWDLVQTALFYERFGWHTDEEYRAFVEAYGFDIMSWSGYPVLADYREIAMTLWLCEKVGSNDGAAAEVRKRVESLRTGSGRRDWSPF